MAELDRGACLRVKDGTFCTPVLNPHWFSEPLDYNGECRGVFGVQRPTIDDLLRNALCPGPGLPPCAVHPLASLMAPRPKVVMRPSRANCQQHSLRTRVVSPTITKTRNVDLPAPSTHPDPSEEVNGMPPGHLEQQQLARAIRNSVSDLHLREARDASLREAECQAIEESRVTADMLQAQQSLHETELRALAASCAVDNPAADEPAATSRDASLREAVNSRLLKNHVWRLTCSKPNRRSMNLSCVLLQPPVLWTTPLLSPFSHAHHALHLFLVHYCPSEPTHIICPRHHNRRRTCNTRCLARIVK